MNQVKHYESTEKHFHRGENISTAVIIVPPRWKYSHRGGAVEIFFSRFVTFSLDSLQRNLDFIVFQLIHVGSSSLFHIIRLILYKSCENQACAQGEIAIMTPDFM